MNETYTTRELLNMTDSIYNMEKCTLRLGKTILRRMGQQSDLCGLDLETYTREALNNYGNIHQDLHQCHTIFNMQNEDDIRELAKKEAIYYIKFFKEKDVDITAKELTDLIKAKIFCKG